MRPKPRKWFGPLRRFRHRLTGKLFGRSDTFTKALKNFLSNQQPKGIWSRIGTREHSTHFGPKTRIPDLFQRRDQVYLALEAQRLQWHTPTPLIYHDLLDAVARVGHIEECTGYIFKNKMLGIEALKLTSSVIPLYFKGVVHQVGRNNRLALLGDRVLKLALCEVWFQTGNTTGDYGKMTHGSESRAVLFTRGHALGIHKNLLPHQWPYSPPTDHQIAESVEAILGAVYLDSGKSIEAVKEVIAQAALDTHKLLKTNAQSQDVQEQKELASLRIIERNEQDEQVRAAAGKPRRPFNAAALGRKLAAEQVKRQAQEVVTTIEGQAQNKFSETAQTQTRSEVKTALTHAEASESLADLIRYKARTKEKESLKTDKQKSRALNEEALSENRDRALDSKSQRRAVAAANKLSKEGDRSDDISEHDGTTADSRRQRSPVSRAEERDKVDTPHKPDSQDSQTSSLAGETTLKAEDQRQQNNVGSTATTQDTRPSSQDELPVEELAGLTGGYARSRRQWWRDAVNLGAELKKKGINVDTRELYEKKKRSRLKKESASRLYAPNMRVEEQPSTKEADHLSAPEKEVGEHPSTKKASRLSKVERLAQKNLRRRARRKLRREEVRRYERDLAEIQPQKDPVAPLEPSEETRQAPASLLPEPPTTTVTKANSIQEDVVPASITIEQEGSPAIESDEAGTATSTVPAPSQELSDSSKETDPTSLALCSNETDTVASIVLPPSQELSGTLKKTRLPALNASQRETSPALRPGENEAVTPPAPVQKPSSSPEEPNLTKGGWAASKSRNELIQELSRRMEETGFASASATNCDDDKEIQLRTKDAEQLERDILNSHRDVWQANWTADSPRKPRKRHSNRVASARRSLQNSLILAEQLTGRAPINRTTRREEDAGPNDWMRKDSQQADTKTSSFVRFSFPESDTDRLEANITKDDSVAPGTPPSKPEKRYTLYTPSVERMPGKSQSRAKLGEWSLSESKR